jgi:hypothetical protein
MLAHKNKYIYYLVLLNGLLASLLVIEGKMIFIDARPLTAIAIALVMFFIYELFVIWYMENKSKSITARQSVNVFLGIKMGKIILSLLFIAVYALVVKVELKYFVLVFLALYFIYLFFDTIYLASREKENKKKYKLDEIEKLSNYYKKE